MMSNKNTEDFNLLRINTELLGRVIAAKFNGEFIPNRKRSLSVITRDFNIEKPEFTVWRKELNKLNSKR